MEVFSLRVNGLSSLSVRIIVHLLILSFDFRIWDQCNVVQDYLTVWDGGSKDSPVLVRLCGGDAVPDIVSRGPRMLLEFHTSPYDNPFHPVPLSYLPGFELEVQVSSLLLILVLLNL